MKTLLVASVVLSIVSSAHAGERIVLDREEITAQSANLTLVRTAKTPAKVRISVPVDATYTECVGGWETRARVVDRSTRPECRSVVENMGYRGMRAANHPCSPTVEVCRGFAKVAAKEWKKVVLKFKDTAGLVGGEEAYALAVSQNAKNELDFDYSLKSISIGAKHEIVERSGEVLSVRIAAPRFIVR